MKAITLLAAAAALITTASPTEVSCNAGFVLLNGNTCIQVFTSKVTWVEAVAACANIDNFLVGSPHLAYFNDCSFMTHLYDYIYYQQGLSEDLWLGGSDSNTEGAWEFLNGDPVPMGIPFWHPIQPDGDNIENKLVFAHNGYFADAHEDDKLGYICQYTP
uniref:C-type lectin n=1 Tax=Eriocheir sinensis TaxID=95602 RepID=K4F935_ERISI|nr:C-type lectin [Eriocheir sinensis]